MMTDCTDSDTEVQIKDKFQANDSRLGSRELPSVNSSMNPRHFHPLDNVIDADIHEEKGPSKSWCENRKSDRDRSENEREHDEMKEEIEESLYNDTNMSAVGEKDRIREGEF